MTTISRRGFLGAAAAAATTAAFTASIERASATPANRRHGDIRDVDHVVVLMMENRSFDHYFGTLPGVRGFGDRFPVPLASGKPVWYEADVTGELVPFHLDTETTTAMRVPGTPHSWGDAHAAWNDGRFGRWVEVKKFQSMGHYERADIPFQSALADAFTVCDHHHCALQTGTLANRVVFMSGTNVTPGRTVPATNQAQAMIDNSNNEGATVGRYSWTTYPERLEQAGVSWQIYQDPVDNWGGLLAPWETFTQYHEAKPGNPLYERAMSKKTLEDLGDAVRTDTLPSVSWVVPSRGWSEHPSASSPLQGAGFTQRVLDTLTSNPEVWSRTALIISFDENDGFFDHVPPPAVPSYDEEGALAGATTLDSPLGGEYYTETIDGASVTRPYGMGPRVPLYVVSPFSRGGWVSSEVFDHTSTIQFLERRFGVHEPNITPWHRAVAGDLTSAFDFDDPNGVVPPLPDMSAATEATLVITGKPPVTRPDAGEQHLPVQPRGLRRSRPLPYDLSAVASVDKHHDRVDVRFRNAGSRGAVVHVYDQLHLDRVPRRYTVEAGKQISAVWATAPDGGHYDLWVLGPAGWHRHIRGQVRHARHTATPELRLTHRHGDTVELLAHNDGADDCELVVTDTVYGLIRRTRISVGPGRSVVRRWRVSKSLNWYDLTVTMAGDTTFLRRFAGRVESGRRATSDPAVGQEWVALD
jgi:phospholipase C